MNESTHLFRQFTFTIGLDDLAILFRVNPVFPVSHLVPFTRFNLTTGFRRKFFDGSEENYVRKNKFHARIYTIMQFDTSWCDRREKKPLTFPACVKTERNKNCANSIRSRLRNEMEDSNNNAAKQANISVSSLNNFQGDYGKELLDFMIKSSVIFPRWGWWDDDSKT